MDDIIYKTKNWDSIILKYENSFEDNIFRIRCSKYKNETYKDVWECGYKPDTCAFYTKKWLNTVGQWNPCIGPDTFQECVSYYLIRYGENFQRNIIDSLIKFDGQEVSTKLKFKERIQRTRIYYKSFFRLMSYKNQAKANLAAYKIADKIKSKNMIINFEKLKRRKIYIKNFSRRFNFFLHRGSPNHIINNKSKNIIFILWCYLSFLDKIVIILSNFLYKKNFLKKFIKDKNQLKKIEKIINDGKIS